MTLTKESPVSLAGTVKWYERHFFLCSGHTDWPIRIEEEAGLAQALHTALLSYQEQKVKVTACQAQNLVASGGQDILIWPDKIRYLNVQVEDVPALVQQHLVEEQLCDHLAWHPVSGHHIFVCVHGRRDERCGQCGPPLVASFRHMLAERGLQDMVTVYQSSHVGGHAYAGNVLFYPRGDWYGFVTPEDVPELVERHLIQGELVDRLWRGRMGLATEEQLQQQGQLR